MTVEWLTTLPNPHVRGYGYDAGQRGWKLHAVVAEASATLLTVRGFRALCGLLPGHGWGLDLFIDAPCARCVKVALAKGILVPEEMVRMVERREDMRRRLRAGSYRKESSG